MFRLSRRASLALAAGLVLAVPGIAYAAPVTPTPSPAAPGSPATTAPTRTPDVSIQPVPSEPSPTAEPTKNTVQFGAVVSKRPQQPFDYAQVRVTKPQDEGFRITTDYGHRAEFDSYDTTRLDAFIPAPNGGWKPGTDYTVTVTAENGQATRVTVRLVGEPVELDYRVTLTRPAKPTDPVVLQLHGIKVGDPVQITVSAFEMDGGVAYLETTAQSTTPRFSIRSGDGEQVHPTYDGRWDPALTYLVTIRVGENTGPNHPSWNGTFKVAEPGAPAPSTKPGQNHDRRGGLAKTGW